MLLACFCIQASAQVKAGDIISGQVWDDFDPLMMCNVVEIDHKDGVWIDDCVDLSRFIEGKLDRNDEDYELEVGSAGIGQPFKVYRQYENHVGDGVEVHTNNREKLKGVLKAVDENGITITMKVKYKPEGAKRAKMVDEDKTLAFSEIESCQAQIDFK